MSGGLFSRLCDFSKKSTTKQPFRYFLLRLQPKHLGNIFVLISTKKLNAFCYLYFKNMPKMHFCFMTVILLACIVMTKPHSPFLVKASLFSAIVKKLPYNFLFRLSFSHFLKSFKIISKALFQFIFFGWCTYSFELFTLVQLNIRA